MIARRAAHASVVSAAVALVAALAAVVQWRDGSPGLGLVVSVVACLAGFTVGVVAQAVGSDRRELRVGLAGLLANAAIAVAWGFTFLAALLGSS